VTEPVVVQALIELEGGRFSGMRLALAAVALLAPGALATLVLPTLGAVEGGALLVVTVVASACAAVVALRDQLVGEPREPGSSDVRDILATRLERRIFELASPPAMLLMAVAVCLVVVTTALVGFSPPAPGLGWLTFLGGVSAILMLANLAWTWTVEVPRLAATLDALDALRDGPAQR